MSSTTLSVSDQLLFKRLVEKAGGLEALVESVQNVDLSDEKTIYGYAYLRVSNPDLENPESLKTQEKIIREYAKLHNVAIIEIFKDVGFSGALPVEQRPAFNNMLWQLQPGQCIVGAASDRLFRSDLEELKKVKDYLKAKNCFMLAPDYTPDDKDTPHVAFLQGVHGLANKYYRDQIAKKIRDGKRRLAMEGSLPHKPVYGWKSGGPGVDWIPIEYEQRALAKIMETKRGNMAMTNSMLIDELVKAGFPYAKEYYNKDGSLKKRSKWSYTSIQNILIRYNLNTPVQYDPSGVTGGKKVIGARNTGPLATQTEAMSIKTPSALNRTPNPNYSYTPRSHNETPIRMAVIHTTPST